MRFTKKTLWLAAVAVLLLALNLLDRGSAERIAEQLPSISALIKDEVTRIEISSAITKIVLEKIDEDADEGTQGVWHITAPIDADADQMGIRSLLNNYRHEIPVDAQVDRGNLDTYGLDPTNGIVVEIWTYSSKPDVSFTIGWDAPGGSSFIRLSGDDAVYRARVGGRHRYEQKPIDWRNHLVLGFEPQHVQQMSFHGAEDWGVKRGPSIDVDTDGAPIPGAWMFTTDQPFAADQLALDALARSLGALRAGDILGADFEGGFSPPAGRVDFELVDHSTRTLTIGSRRVDGAAYVRVQDQGDVFRVSDAPIGRALLPVREYRDKTMFHFNRGDVDTFSFEQGDTSIILQQDLSSGLWNVLQPDNVDVDMKLVFFAINTLSELRAHEVSDITVADAGLDRDTTRLTALFLDGHDETLVIGHATVDSKGRPAWFARVDGEQQVYLLRDRTVKKLKAGFGRS